MGKRGGSKHLKRLAAARSFKLLRKSAVFVQRALPGKHKSAISIPLSYVLMDLGFSKTMKESKQLLSSRIVRVDGKIIAEVKYPVGFMDVISIGDKNWRVLYDSKGRIILKETSNPSTKICMVESKFRSKGGQIQVSLHDGRTVMDYDCKVGDSLEIELPSGKVAKHYPLKVGAKGMIIGGKHISKFATVEEIHPGSATRKSEVEFKSEDEKLRTLLKYLFPMDQKKL